MTPEPKPQVDIATALPSSDDFRTSLLMPNLSARFSMLREQDDPTSKLGKANDDSVLFPKRASRLDLFGSRQGLADIAEVDSIRGSVRPPFANSRTESYTSDGYGTDEGSVMSRSRPGEGNTMFGGRQKIYKIPVGGSGSVKNFGLTEEGELPSGGNMGGKALYESDIATSAFQKLREQERQERERAGYDFANLGSPQEKDRSNSPPLAKYNRNRETSSSTNSGPSQPRTSTAATSVASQKSVYGAHEAINGSSHVISSTTQPNSASSERPVPKGRRMYGQGLDQHMYDQQSSALHRLESLQRPRPGPTTRVLQQSRSATNLTDRYQRGAPLFTSNGFRAGSPPPSATPPRMQDFDLGLGDENAAANLMDSDYGRSPPRSPTMTPSADPTHPDPTLVAALEPNDLGKATASGAFNKPRKQYNEQQYLQRQLQLQEGRGTPSPQLTRPFSPPALSIDERTTGRSRNNSSASGFSMSNSIRHPWEHHMEDRVLRAVPQRTRTPSVSQESSEQNHPAMDHSFLVNGSDVSESETDPSSPVPSRSRDQGFPTPAPQPTEPVDTKQPLDFNFNLNHLAEPAEEISSDSRSHRSEATITQAKDLSMLETNGPDGIDADSPTLGPVGVSNGLSGLVRTHLRNDSGKSSVYPEESPMRSRFPVEARESIFGHESALNQHHNDSWDDEDGHGGNWGLEEKEFEKQSPPMPPPLSLAARHMLEQATALKSQDSAKAKQMFGNGKVQRVLGGEAPRKSHQSTPSWQEQLSRFQHERGGSSETAKERESLDNAMAERKRMVQDSVLQTFAEGDSRSSSPARAPRSYENVPAKPTHPFGILKKSSKGSLVNKSDKPSKAMKMLGIDPSSAQDGNRPQLDMFMGREQLPDRAMPPGKKTSSPSARPKDVSSMRRQREQGIYQVQDQIPQRPSPRSSRSDSAYSDSSDRRPESRKNGAAKASMEGNRVNGYSPNVAGPGIETRTTPSPPRPVDESPANVFRHALLPTGRSRSAMSVRFMSDSRSARQAAFEQRAAPPGTPYMINPGNRPAANPYPHSTHSTPSLRETSSTFSATHPTMSNPQNSHSQYHSYSRPGSSRKRSINKHDISEPTFISCTSSVDTIDLPPGASLSNGMDSPPAENGAAPPIPARDSRRKRTQTLLQALARIEKPQGSSSTQHSSPRDDDIDEERSTFSADDEPTSRSMKQKLRKTSSEANNMNFRARQQAMQSPGPAMPPSQYAQVSPVADHVPYQAQQDVPASAVMF